MNLDRYFIVSSYVLLTASFVILAATRQVDGVSLAMFFGALLVGCLIDLGRLRWNISRRLANGLMIGWLGIALAEWQLFRMPPVLVITHFVLFASALKLLKRKDSRDWLWLYVISFCIVLMSAGLTMGTTFLVLLMVYLLAAISTFIAYEIRRTQQSFLEEVKDQKIVIELWREVNDVRRPLGKPGVVGLLGFSVLALALILILAGPLFLVVPRVSRNAGRNSPGGLAQGEALSGFSDTVRLGEVAQVKLNPQVVMRVRVSYPRGLDDQERQHNLRWRGVTLDRYDGQSWNNIGPDPVPIRRHGEIFHIEPTSRKFAFTEQQFFMEPLNINTVFAAPRPVLASGLPELTRDLGDGLWTDAHGFDKHSYSIYSDTFIPDDSSLAEDNSREFPRNVSQRYLQLPGNHDERIDQLAAKVSEGAKTQIETIRRIELHLKTQYDYSLDLRRVEKGDPVADFLFNTRAGHCEYFASAMVLMLRARRIPARIVNGFQTGEYNSKADVFTVRQSDAHSWVEAYFPKNQWVAFDPTPPAGLSEYDDGIMAWVREYSEAFEMFWLEEVVSFDTSKQISMFVTAQNFASLVQFNVSKHWSRWARKLNFWLDGSSLNDDAVVEKNNSEPANPSVPNFGYRRLALVLLGFAVLGLGFVLTQRLRGRLGAANANAVQQSVKFYQDMLHALERSGHRRQPDQTPMEFAATVKLPAVIEITQMYQRARFGQVALTAEESSRIESLLRELKRKNR
ncbi:MAG: DUF3488 and transglutaminase-like domain-containing protein [Acidobacteriota bacterium]|nr:DUF3488 and transglutaminase-like domain-containing protein [Acidobacteriota bacterium]